MVPHNGEIARTVLLLGATAGQSVVIIITVVDGSISLVGRSIKAASLLAPFTVGHLQARAGSDYLTRQLRSSPGVRDQASGCRRLHKPCMNL